MFHKLPGSSTVRQLQSGKQQGFLKNIFFFIETEPASAFLYFGIKRPTFEKTNFFFTDANADADADTKVLRAKSFPKILESNARLKTNYQRQSKNRLQKIFLQF